MKTRLALALATLILMAPAAVFAQNHGGGNGAHMRPVLFHDRAPRPHVHTVAPHH